MKKSRKSGSGGSSILKVALRPHSGPNISLSSESPATSKVKRRVSFAEKNHVKEFLSAEQGTLWNNTYEELSNINTGQIGINNQNHEIVKNTYHSTSNSMIENENGNPTNDSLELTECFVTPGSFKSIHTGEILLNKSISLGRQNENDDEKISISIESNRNIDICAHKSINVYYDTPNLHNMEDPDLNKTCIEDVPMEITEIPSVIKLPNVSTKRKLEQEDKENIPMSDIIMKSNVPSITTNEMNAMSDETQYFCKENLEFTECLQSIKEPLHLQQKLNKISAFTNNENMNNNQTQIFKNVSMEMTCAIPMVCKINSTNHGVVFHDALMDDTSAITSVINKKEKSISKDISQIENDTRFLKKMFNSVNKTKLMDASMEITEGVYSLPHSTRVNDGTNIATAFNCSSSAIKEKTMLIDDLMEFTIPVTNLSRVVHNTGKEELLQVIPAINDRTELNNDSLEFTVPVNNLSRVVHNIDRKEELLRITPAINDRTKLSNDSLEFTVPVNNLSRVVHNVDRKELFQIIPDIKEKTKLNNDSLEFTVPVNKLSRVVHNTDKEELLRVTPVISDKTELNNDSLELTVPVQNLSRVVHNIGKEELLRITPAINDRTKLSNDSLEFTVPVNNLSRVVHNVDRKELFQIIPDIKEKTKLNNDSLEFTVPVNKLSRVVHNTGKEELLRVTPVISDKTELNNDSVELTVPVQNLSRVVHNTGKEELLRVTPVISDKTELNNDSLELTVPVQNLSRVVHNIGKEELLQVTEIIESTMCNQIRLSSEKEAGIIENELSENNSMNINIPVYFNPISSTITSNTIVNATIQNNSTFKHTINENGNSSLLQSENRNVENQVSNTNEKLVKNDCLLDSMHRITRDHSMDEVKKQTKIHFNNSNDNIKKSVHQRMNYTLSPSTMYYNDDQKQKENITAHNHHTLTSLISSFVYADMIEDDSFVKTIHKVQQETQSSENVMDVNSVIDMVNVQPMRIQCPEICITNGEQIVQQSNNNLECYFENNNIQVDNVMINKEKNNQYSSDKISTIINEIHENHENVFENKLNNERLTNTSIELEITHRDKQLDKKDKNIENVSAACIIKSKKNSAMDISECANAHSSNNQILYRSRVFSPTLISAYNQNKTCIGENNITQIADKKDLTCSMDITQSNDNSLREEIALEKNTKENSSFQEDKFSLLVNKLKNHMLSDDCIWDLYYENIDKQVIVVGFISTSLLIIIYTQNNINTDTCMIKDIKVISRVENDENLFLSIAHKLIIEKINIEYICQSYIYEEDIIPLLNHISEDVKLILDFIFDLKQLEDTNLMEINTESITFISRSKCMEIILKITMDIKLFDKINSSHIKIVSILGTVIEKEIQELLVNVKRDHKFLRRYMSDIKDYIDIIEQVNFAKKKCRS